MNLSQWKVQIDSTSDEEKMAPHHGYIVLSSLPVMSCITLAPLFKGHGNCGFWASIASINKNLRVIIHVKTLIALFFFVRTYNDTL